jgi:hypothetical protein
LAQPAADALNGIANLSDAARRHPEAGATALLGTLGGGALASFWAATGLAGHFGLIAPETAARWGLTSVAGGVVPVTAAAGAALSYKAASTVRDNPAAFQPLLDNPMLGALGGDYTLAQAILHPPPRQDEMKITVEVKPADGFWAKVTSFFTSRPSGQLEIGTTGSRGQSMEEAAPAYDMPAF